MTDVRRLARGVVLGCWAAFFVWLHVSGEKTRYLGPRTYWVIAFGAVVLAAAAIGHFATARRARSSLGFRDAAGVAALLLPLVAVAAVPSADLGALAASRKSTGVSASSVGAIAPPVPGVGEDPSFVDVYYASESPEYAAEAGVTEGMPIQLTGFVTRPDGLPEGTFGLTRFYVSCCAADALPYTVPVASGSKSVAEDDWLEVEGSLVVRDGVYTIAPERVAPVDTPDDPYLY